ncbi:GGDEF domain-containing protein [Microbulbifer yueqingensis]|uniref:diguanylate cyclase n=1 Tax=Microbulbifer yueqingensis TaxID=658219 RepID=A0A1G8VG85_9GAMM|nr:GGDEF domain-containing protein [Microbulbifer yueqingensis]SDJ65058.1 diguanylate cyclase (GGDEF) domain-containing protein [Microbulbifer yueqingensis]
MPFLVNTLRYGWLSALTLGLAAALYFQPVPIDIAILPRLALLLLGAALGLGIYFKASRLAFVACQLLAGYILLGQIPADGRSWLVAHGLALLALNTSIVMALRDRSVISFFGLLLAGVLVLEMLGLGYLYDCCAGIVTAARPLAVVLAGLPLGHIGDWLVSLGWADLGFLVAAILGLAVAAVRRDPVNLGLLSSVLLTGAVYVLGAGPRTLVILAACAGLLLALLALRSAYELAFRDDLTGIPSRRAYSRYLLTLGRSFSIAVVDIDHFKKLNDRYGHQVGDQALRMVAGKIARYGGGRAFRYGGEEFVLVFRGRNRERAERALEDMRKRIAGYPLRIRGANRPHNKSAGKRLRGRGGSQSIKTSVSVGLASASRDMRSPDEVLAAADKALYRAKRAGRNRVCTHK